MEVERLKVSNAELNKLAADNAERLVRRHCSYLLTTDLVTIYSF